jgi:hypothetical protein
LLVFGEAMSEVVQLFVDPARFNKRAGPKYVEPLVSKIVVDQWFKGLLGQHIG